MGARTIHWTLAAQASGVVACDFKHVAC